MLDPFLPQSCTVLIHNTEVIMIRSPIDPYVIFECLGCCHLSPLWLACRDASSVPVLALGCPAQTPHWTCLTDHSLGRNSSSGADCAGRPWRSQRAAELVLMVQGRQFFDGCFVALAPFPKQSRYIVGWHLAGHQRSLPRVLRSTMSSTLSVSLPAIS